ncbi:MAG: hypothetical protein M1833_006544 [Piccolia ochrophora]|nr:MAG: hypothetical protein M1833_006544 [Piccolia ochrophora]
MAVSGYNAEVENFRDKEYPMLQGVTYLDHGGTTLYATSLMEQFTRDMTSNLFGNPHADSPSSQRSTTRVDNVRVRILKYFHADPEHFDVVFVANATAAIKLVMEAFRDHGEDRTSRIDTRGFWYGYHRDSHTSLVGVREVARAGHVCFSSDEQVDEWLSSPSLGGDDYASRSPSTPGLFAYPAQSNLDGRRLPLDWCRRLRQSESARHRNTYSLLDAAALVSTAPLDLSKSAVAPDFTAMSFYKIFGFPDLGALIVRKESAHVLLKRKYFGGGTVDMVISSREAWHARKSDSVHDQLEDGTLPIHSIIALQAAFDVHERLYGTPERVSRHTAFLARELYRGLSSLHHSDGEKVCEIYTDPSGLSQDATSQGPVIALNVRNCRGGWVGNSEVEKLAAVRNIHLRTGRICNAGGIAHSLGLSSSDMRRNFLAGQRCGDDNDIISGRPTGVIRLSLGSMSTHKDVSTVVEFFRDFYAERVPTVPEAPTVRVNEAESVMEVESLTIYPIKSCGGWKIPHGTPWEIKEEGLAWDREWCLVHKGTGKALSQKQYPRMAHLCPSIDLKQNLLRVRMRSASMDQPGRPPDLLVPLSEVLRPNTFEDQADHLKCQQTRVCGDAIIAQAYTDPEIGDFFTRLLNVPCTLARFPAGGCGPNTRHSKYPNQRRNKASESPILLSNESPILTISRPSLDCLNEQIRANGGKAAQPEVFRANIVLAASGDKTLAEGRAKAYEEDQWNYMRIGREHFQVRHYFSNRLTAEG